jgi:GTP-binding protein
LLNEITQYNPELAEKQRILAITKCDMLDQELMDEMKQLLPKDIPSVFISSISGLGINQLKDLIWSELHKDGYKKEIEISHKPIEVQQIEYEEEDDIEEETFDTIYMNEEDEEWDLEKYKGIGWDQ